MTAALLGALRRLAVVLAAVALLGHGGVEVAPRLLTAGATVAAASSATPTAGRPASTRPAAESQPVERGSALRFAAAAPVLAGGADTVAGPGPARRLAPHLVARPVVRPPTAVHVRAVRAGVSGRAPPAAAGT